jgi:hypothetical protein
MANTISVIALSFRQNDLVDSTYSGSPLDTLGELVDATAEEITDKDGDTST